MHRAALAAVVLFWSFAATAAEPDYWPTDGWRTATPESQGMDSELLTRLVTEIKAQGGIDSVTIVRNGYLVLDAYFQPFQRDLKHVAHSVSKSFTSALIGIAIDRGEIEGTDKPVLDLFPDRAIDNVDERKRAMTLEHVLTMTTGLACEDSFRYRWRNLTAMRRSADWAKHVLDRPMQSEPGTSFEYCNGATYLLSAMLQRATGATALAYANEHLFGPLGITDLVWPANAEGVTWGYDGLRLHPRDMAKFGWLYLNRGRWDGKQVVPAAWVERSLAQHTTASPLPGYGYQWWLRKSGHPAAVGYRAQFIYLEPDLNMVVVFTSDLPGGRFFTPEGMTNLYIRPAASDGALPANPVAETALAEIVAEAARPHDVVWSNADDGIVSGGEFVRTAAPAFRFTVPAGSRKLPLQAAEVVARLKHQTEFIFAAAVIGADGDVAPARFGPDVFGPLMRQSTRADNEIIANRAITLADGTAAYRSEFLWRYEDFDLHTYVVSARRGGHWVTTMAHAWLDPADAIAIVESLRFD